MNESLANKMTWESSKENVQPIRSGRNISCLEAALQPSEQDTQHLLQERQRFEEEILAGENTKDPIDAWDRYLKWTQQHFPIGENSKNYENLLQKYIVKFLKYDQYKNDPRYVNSWLTMALISDNPTNIFAYMNSEGIGTSCASFYVAWAEEFEKYHNFKRAAAVYELGEQNNAQPAALLSKMKSAFELRTARASMSGIQRSEDDSSEILHASSLSNERKALGNLHGLGSKKIVGSVRKPGENSTFPLKSANAKTQSNIGSSGTKKLVFFNDDENQKPTVGKTGKWADMPKSDVLKKENSLQDPTPWNGRKLHQRGSSSSSQPTPSTFTIFQESDPDNTHEASSVQQPARNISRNVEHFLAERKIRQPEESSLHRAIREAYGDKMTNTVCMYPVDKVYSVMGEFQLEEVIAARWRRKMREKMEEEERLQKEYQLKLQAEEYKRQNEEMKNQMKAAEQELIRKRNQLKEVLQLCDMKLGDADDENEKLPRECEEITVKLESVCGRLRKHKPKNTLLETAEYDQPFTEESIKEFPLPPIDDSSSTRDAVSANSSCNLSKRALPSPTVCTKEALGNIMDMFKLPLPQETSIFSDYTQDSAAERAKSFKVFRDESVNVPASNFDRCESNENEEKQKYSSDKAQENTDVVKTPFGLLDRKSLKIPQQVPIEASSRANETHPTFLGDISIARGQNGEFANDDLSTSSVFYPSQDESTHSGFAPCAKILAESTSLWPAANMKTPFTCSDPSDAMNDDGSPKKTKKLSPILEASVEVDKSVTTKSQLHCESLPPPKSFIRPPTVDRKRFADVSAVTYEEDSSIQFLPSTSVCNNQDSTKPAFSIFADEDVSCSTNTKIDFHSNKLPSGDFVMDKSLLAQPVTQSPSTSGFGMFADVSMDCKENASMNFLSSLRIPNDSEMNPVDLVQPIMSHSPLPSTINILGSDGMDCDADLHTTTLTNQPGQNRSTMNSLQMDGLNLDGLCSELMETSLSELDRDKTDLKLEPLPNTSGCFEKSLQALQPSTVGQHGSNPPIMRQSNHALLEPSPQATSDHGSKPLDAFAEGNSFSSRLKIVRDPWADDALLSIMELSPHQPKNMTRISGKMPRFRKGSTCTFGKNIYSIVDAIGKGAFAKVHQAVDERNKSYAIKVQSPAYPWEVHILDETKRRLKFKLANFNTDLLMDINHAVIFDDASCIMCDFIPYGTLLDYLNYMHETKKTPPHSEIAFSILTLIDALHSVDIIHGDIKPDNFMVCSDYRSSEPQLRLKLIDFGRGIDMRAFPPGTAFTRDCGTEGFVCGQMKLKQPWSYHTDYYGVAGTLHVVLTRSYMGTVQDKCGTWKTISRLPRWTGKCWTKLFETLLNFPTPTDEWWPTYRDSPLPSLISLFEHHTQETE